MIRITDKSKCCGCTACASVCPNQCISMKEDKEGFLYPRVELKKCIDCGLCEKVCPVIHSKNAGNEVKNTYIAYAKDKDLRMMSSSGGIFSLCADWILEQGGIVTGAAFDEELLVHHICIDNKKDLDKLRGSKYLQSRMENVYSKVKVFLDDGKKVLFTGTACQIAGLKSYLRKEYADLYTMDVLCHGVPSPKVWIRHLQEAKTRYGAEIRHVYFRNKKYGWKNYSVAYQLSNSRVYLVNFVKDDFMKAFLQNICLRPSCHACKFKALSRTSDLTIGDCWGVENYMPDMDDDSGTSIVFIHSQKGKLLFDMIKNRLAFQKADRDCALPPEADSRKSVMPHPKRRAFFVNLEKGVPMDKLVKLLEPGFVGKVFNKIKRITTHK